MLEVTTISQEQTLDVDFSDIYKKSELYMWVTGSSNAIIVYSFPLSLTMDHLLSVALTFYSPPKRFSYWGSNLTFDRKNKALIEELNKPLPGSSDLHFPTRYSQYFLSQCIACLWKQNLSYWRNPPYNAVRFLFTIMIALLFGTIYWDLGGKM